MADEEDVFIREIDEELKQENLQKLWSQYGTALVAAALALVIGVAGIKGWQAYDLSERQAISERFTDAQKLAREGKRDTAAEAFRNIATDSGAGYRMLARFQVASLAAKSGDTEAAAQAYEALANDESVETLYRELAVVLGALIELDSKSGANKLIPRAEQLATGNGPWRFSAKEVAALAALQNGDVAQARERYAEIAKDAAAPQGLRTRAQEMENVLKGK